MATVKELKRVLSEYPDEMIVLLSADEEGNAFGQCSNVVGNHVYKNRTEVLVLYPETYIEPDDVQGDWEDGEEPQPKLKGWWCDQKCPEDDREDVTYMPDNTCPCGVVKHHYHSNKCGHIIQIG